MAFHVLPSSRGLSRQGKLVSTGFTGARNTPAQHPGQAPSDGGIKNGGRDLQGGGHEGLRVSWE